MKILARTDPYFEGFVEKNQKLISYAQGKLAELDASLATMIPPHKWWRLSPQFYLLASKRVGPTGLDNLCFQSDETLRNFLFRMLALTQIPPFPISQTPICHGDLRGPNVTVNGEVVDFEFLGTSRPRPSQPPEISKALAEWEALSVCDTAWQLAILLVEALDVKGRERSVQLKAARFERRDDPFLVDFKAPLSEFWRKTFQMIVTEFGDLETFRGRNAETLQEKCNKFFLMFHPKTFSLCGLRKQPLTA